MAGIALHGRAPDCESPSIMRIFLCPAQANEGLFTFCLLLTFALVSIVAVFSNSDENDATAVPPSDIHVTIQNLSGEIYELTMPSNATVRSLKENVEICWRCPSECQKILHETEVVNDGDLIGTLCAENVKELKLSLLLSSEYIGKMSRMSMHQCQSIRLRAVRFFSLLGARAGDIGVNLLFNCLQDDIRPSVRRSALHALLQIANGGYDAAISVLRPTLQIVEEDERRVVARVWLQLLKDGNKTAMMDLCKLLQIHCIHRARSICSLLLEVRKHDGRAIVEATRLLKCWTNGVAEPEPTFKILSAGCKSAKEHWDKLARSRANAMRDGCRASCSHRTARFLKAHGLRSVQRGGIF